MTNLLCWLGQLTIWPRLCYSPVFLFLFLVSLSCWNKRKLPKFSGIDCAIRDRVTCLIVANSWILFVRFDCSACIGEKKHKQIKKKAITLITIGTVLQPFLPLALTGTLSVKQYNAMFTDVSCFFLNWRQLFQCNSLISYYLISKNF